MSQTNINTSDILITGEYTMLKLPEIHNLVKEMKLLKKIGSCIIIIIARNDAVL